MKNTKYSYKEMQEEILAMSPDKVKAIADVSGGDGHSIFDASAYQEAGMSDAMLGYFTRQHSSDGSYKGSIFGADGKVIPNLVGVYGLTVVEAIASALKLEAGSYMGRGFRAQAAIGAINKWAESKPTSVAS